MTTSTTAPNPVPELESAIGPIAAPDLYARLSEPHPNLTSVQEALDAFFMGVRLLREELRIPDVPMVVSVKAMSHVAPDGTPLETPQVADLICRMYNGDSRLEGRLLSYGLGQVDAEQAAVLDAARQQGYRTQAQAMARKQDVATGPAGPTETAPGSSADA